MNKRKREAPLTTCQECYSMHYTASTTCWRCGHYTQAYYTRQRKKDHESKDTDTRPAADPAQSV